MKLQDMFLKSIDRPINGVIKVMQTDDQNRRQELEEYVITRELQKHFGAFYDQYEKGIEGSTDKIGVWISGFFGSGKSHFLKILSYLLANEEVDGKKAIDYFEDKFAYDPYRYAMMRRISETPTEVILFNIDAKSPMGKDSDAILRVFTKVFYEHCGYYGDDMKVASLERFLDRQGKLDAFKEAFLKINTEPWQTAREAFAFWEDDIVQALTQVTGMSEQSAHNWFNGEETSELSIDRLAREISEYVESKAPNFHLIFSVDEIGQYIGDNSGLMLNLQTVVEELGSKCMGKVWVIVTSQEDIDSVTHVKGNDFSKIQGRFNTRLSLSSASVDEVIKRRILSKTETADTLLRLNYQQNSSVMRNLFSFAPGTIADLKGYSSEDEFVEAYPFVPYQFKLLQEVLVQVRKHGSSGKHLSGGERSMLSAFQEAAQKFKFEDENCFVPFYAFYDTVHTFLDGAIRRVIDRATRAAQTGDGLKEQDVDVLKLLFLIRYVDGIASNIENLSTLMISDIHADKVTLRRVLQESLDRLVHENYASRNGETYLFLTDEEQDINREIRNVIVDQNEVIHMIGQAVFGDLYPGKKYRYKNRYDFAYDQMVDNAVVGQPASDIKLRLITLASGLQESDADAQLILQSRAGNEAIVLLNNSGDYYQEFEEVRRIEKYIKQRNISQLPESIRKIIQAKQSEAKEREKTATNLLKDAIVKGSFYISGERRANSLYLCKGNAGRGAEPSHRGRVQQARLCRYLCSIRSGNSADLVRQRRAGNHGGRGAQRYGTGRNAAVSGNSRAPAYDHHHGGDPEALPVRALRLAGDRHRRPHRRICVRGHRIQLLYAGALPLPPTIAARRTACASAPKRRKTVVRQKVSAPDSAARSRPGGRPRELLDFHGPAHARKKAFCGQLEALLSGG